VSVGIKVGTLISRVLSLIKPIMPRHTKHPSDSSRSYIEGITKILSLIKNLEMKKLTLSGVLILLIMTGFSQVQCPDYFKRNNGTCGDNSTSEMQLYYEFGCPKEPLPIIDSVYYNGIKVEVTFREPSAEFCKLNYVNYCIISGNIPPAIKLNIYMTFGDSAYGIPGGRHVMCTVINGGPLPIILNSFSLSRRNNNVSVFWKSTNETNIASYDIQRSYDNITYVSIATIASHNATGNTITNYSFVDNNISKNVSYYRIKVNSTGIPSIYSDVKTVNGMKITGDVVFYPNPVSANSLVTLSEAYSQCTIQIIDNSGRLVQTVSLQNNNTFRLNNLTKGLYFIKLINTETGKTSVQKMAVAE
jgi:hypothetical protein